MKTCPYCSELKPLSAFYKNKNGSQGVAAYCKICDGARRKAHFLANPEQKRVSDAAWRLANLGKTKEYNSAYYAENKAEVREFQAAYYVANKEQMLLGSKKWRETNKESETLRKQVYRVVNNDTITARRRKHYADNKPVYIANARRREADKLRATPVWANLDAITALYVLREKLTAETGILHHVDHIIPLRGRAVCGLHVHNNLRVIPAAENLRRGNRLIEGSTHCLEPLL